MAVSLCYWLPFACLFGEVVWWGARDLNQSFSIPDSEIFLCMTSLGVGRIPLQTCAVLLLFPCKLCVTLCCWCKHSRWCDCHFLSLCFRTTFCYLHHSESYVSFLNIMKNLQLDYKYQANSANVCRNHKTYRNSFYYLISVWWFSLKET